MVTLHHKNEPLLFFEKLREALADFKNFWRATSRRNSTQMPVLLATSLK